MKNLIPIILIIILTSLSFHAYSDEVQIESKDINIINDGNTVLAKEAQIIIPKENMKILSDLANYEKISDIVTFTKNVFFNDKKNNVIIEGDFVKYERKKDLIYSDGKTNLNIENKYKVETNNVFYDRTSNIIYSQEETLIEDNKNNFYILKNGFKFKFFKEIIKSKKSIIIDKNNNKYIFENLLIDLKTNEIAGKELKVEFEKSYFGNKNNEPLLRGRSSYSNEDELKVYKAVFSTCNIKNKKCRGWELNSDEFKHIKIRKFLNIKILG